METILSPAEWKVAEEFAAGCTDEEAADRLIKSVWTVRTQKRAIYRKLGISKDTELLLYVVCIKLKKDFNLKEIRKHGIEILFCTLFMLMQVGNYSYESYRIRSRSRIAVRSAARKKGSLEITEII